MNRNSVLTSGACAARVRRFHTWPMLQTQTVGQHAARVATLYVEIFGLPRAEVLYFALRHDDGELYAGDTPSFAKREVPDLGDSLNAAERVGLSKLEVEVPALKLYEYARVKVCDNLELWEHASADMHMGNRYARPAIVHARQGALDRAANTGVDGDEQRVLDWIRREEKRYAEW